MPDPEVPSFLLCRDLRESDLASLDEALFTTYAWMFCARTVDNRILEMFRQGKILGTVTGGQGNEGLIVPLTLLADKALDVISFSHRGLGGHLIWSGSLTEHLCQYIANAGSPTKAREGNIHHGDPANRSLPMISHLGIMLSNVVGGTDSQRRMGRPAVGFAFFGDGGSSTGDVHESMNLASVLGVPVVFVIENNEYAYSTPVSEQFNGPALVERARGYGFEGVTVDATDIEATLRTLEQVISRCRETGRPALVEAHTLRLRGHAAYDTCDYMREGEQEAAMKRDPLPRLRSRLEAAGFDDRLDGAEKEISAFIEASINHALSFPPADPAGMMDEVFAPAPPPAAWKATPAAAQMNLAQAINNGLRKILEERPESVVLGEDIGLYGGAFKVTDGLLKSFGRARVLNTPLAESAFTGYAIGLAVNGHRPIVEFQFADFSTDAATQIMLNAATYHFRAGACVPMVMRFPCGGGLTFGSFHSQELESLFLSMPGLKAFYPSTPQDMFNALLAAYEDNNPVIIFEHKGLYRRGKSEVSFDPAYLEVWKPKRLREGDFATLVTYGEMTLLAMEAAEYFESEFELKIEVWDLRALSPLDLDAIHESVARTHRVVVLHEGRRTHGFGAELVSRFCERHGTSLKAPPLRITAKDMPVPFAPELEAAYRPSTEKVIEAISDWMG